MAYILNIETATDICSIAIAKEGKLSAFRECTTTNHAAHINLLIHECLEESAIKITDLSAVAISNGPGSYTSLRVGASTAKGICYALDIPMIAIDTLKSMALASFAKTLDNNALYCPMIDARRMEVYAAIYGLNCVKNAQNHAENTEITEGVTTFRKSDEGQSVWDFTTIENIKPMLIDENSFENYFKLRKKIIFSGNGAAKCTAILSPQYAILDDIQCSAKHMTCMSFDKFQQKDFVDIAYHTPEYLKMPNITVAKKVF